MLVLLGLLLFAPPVPDSPLAGNWVTMEKDVVQIAACSDGAALCVRLVALGRSDTPKTDVKNPDPAMRTRALCGLMIGTGFVPDGADKAKGGRIYDPESGKTYSGQMEVTGDGLKLRGYVGTPLFGRTEVWHRASGVPVACH